MPRRFGGPTKARPARPRLRRAACRRPRRLLSRDRRVVPRAPQGRSGRRQMRLAAMPAAELQETGRIPPNAHHSMPEYGCRPCSGLDPPMIKKVGAPCRRRPERKWTRHAGDARKERSVDPAVRVRDGAPGCARSRWSPRLCVFTMDAARAETPVPSPRGKGAKVKVGRRPAGGASRQLRQPPS